MQLQKGGLLNATILYCLRVLIEYCAFQIKSLNQKVKGLEQTCATQRKTIKMMQKIASAKDLAVLELNSEVRLLKHQFQNVSETVPNDTEDYLESYGDYLQADVRENLLKIDKRATIDRTFIRLLLPNVIKDLDSQKYSLTELKMSKVSTLTLIKKIFVARVSACTKDTADFAQRIDDSRISKILSKILSRQKQSVSDIRTTTQSIISFF